MRRRGRSLVVGASLPDAAAGAAPPATINGSGSTYVALAMQQWVADAQTQRALRSTTCRPARPTACTSYGNWLIDFAGTEAEFSRAAGGRRRRRRRARLPVRPRRRRRDRGDVQRRRQGRPQGRLPAPVAAHDRPHLHRRHLRAGPTRRSRADNKGLVLPEPAHHRRLPQRASRARPALFYDFVQQRRARRLQRRGPPATSCPTNVRIIQLDSTPSFAPKTQALNGSDQIAQYVASDDGQVDDRLRRVRLREDLRRARGVGAERVGQLGAALRARTSRPRSSRRTLRPDLSQELSGVYSEPEPGRLPDLGVQLHRHAVRAGRRPADVQGRRTRTPASPRRWRSGCATSRATAR